MKFSVKYLTIICFVTLLMVGCASDYSKDISGSYYFYSNDGVLGEEVLSHSPDKKGIYGEVVECNSNNDFIIAIQKPSYESYKANISFYLKKDPAYKSRKDKTISQISDSILNNDPFYKKVFMHKINYWIIDNKAGQVLGPFTIDEYLKKRKELNVPEKLNYSWG